MANLSTLFGGGIKSIQTGTISIGSGASSGTAAITAVNTAKAFLINDGVLDSVTTSLANVQLVLTSGTVVTAQRAAVAFTSVASFTVVEFF